MFKENGTNFGRVDDPTTAKFAPFLNLESANESKYGRRKLVFKLWPAQTQVKKCLSKFSKTIFSSQRFLKIRKGTYNKEHYKYDILCYNYLFS